MVFFFISADQTTANRRGGLQSALVGKNTMNKNRCHCEPVRLPGVAIPLHSGTDCEIATAPLGPRNDSFLDCHTPFGGSQ